MKRLLIACVLVLAGCARKELPLSSGGHVSGPALSAMLGGAVMGDDTYAVVSREALPRMYEEFRGELFSKGVTKWDERFDCNHFASYYVALAQTKYYLANFHSGAAPQSLALGVYWLKDGNGAHALVVALTDAGIVFIEPQTGKEVALTGKQKAGAFMKFFG
jgi:hypothetical protein